MKSLMEFLFRRSAVAALFTLATTLFAQTPAMMTDIGATAPTPGPADISQLSAAGDVKFPDTLNYYTDNGANHGMWAGQTFTTGNSATGYILSTVSIFTAGLDDGGGYNNPQLFHLYIYSVSGTTATLIGNYTNYSSFTDGDWLQWTNLGGLALQANSTYAYGFGRDSSGSGWAGLGNATNNPYAGGELAMIPTFGGAITFGSTHSIDATFEIGLLTNNSPTPPQILTQPSSVMVFSNAPATFSVVALSPVAMNYQWRFGTSPLANQTNSSLNIAHTGAGDVGGYTVVVSNIYGAVTSSPAATLTEVSLPAGITYSNSVLAAQPAGYWPLDRSIDTGTTANDFSGHGNFGTYNGGYSEVAGPSSRIPNGVRFDGATARVDLSPGPNTSVLNFGGTITMEAWVQLTYVSSGNNALWNDGTAQATALGKGQDNSQDTNCIEMGGNYWGNYDGGSYSGSTGLHGQLDPTQFGGGDGGGADPLLSDSNWHHEMVSYDGAHWNFYLDGVLMNATPDTVGAINSTTPWAIGTGTADGAGNFFPGNICEVALYTNALTGPQAYIHYVVGLYGGTSNLPPLIGTQPASQSAYTNGVAIFSVSVPPPAFAPVTYQWYVISGGVTNQINGATNSTYNTPPANSSMNGNGYFVLVSDNAGRQQTSAAATLTLIAGEPSVLSIKTDPSRGGYQTLLPADKTGLYPTTNWNSAEVAVSGGDQSFFLKDNTGAATAVKLTVRGVTDGWMDNATPPDSAPVTKLLNTFIKYGGHGNGGVNTLGNGLLQLVLTNLDNSKTYDLYMYFEDDWAPPASTQPDYADVDGGSGLTNYVGPSYSSVSGATNFVLASGGAPGSPAQGNAIRMTGLAPTAGAITISVNYDPLSQAYSLGVCGFQLVESSIDTLPVSIVGPPEDERVVTNTPATFSVAALGVPTPSYQWYSVVNGVTNLIANATNASYTTAPVQDSDTGTGYFVVVSNYINSVNSPIAILTAGHMVTASGLLVAAEYFGNYPNGATAIATLYPTASSLPAPDKLEYLSKFNDKADLPNNGGERIYGWFTPPVTGNYIFFTASDDVSALWLSTNSSPTNVYEIAQNQAWMVSGNDGPTDWTLVNTNSGEGPYLSTGEWRSDKFELGGGPNAFATLISGWAPWPGLNADGSISLQAGTPYYIEMDHYQGGGGQGAAVTYKLAGNPDPSTGAASLLTGNVIFASVPDSVAPEPQPRITSIHVSGSAVAVSGSNGLVNAVYNVLNSSNVALPLSNWTVLGSARFDSSGNFSSTNASAGGQSFYIIQVP